MRQRVPVLPTERIRAELARMGDGRGTAGQEPPPVLPGRPASPVRNLYAIFD
jgi:hypothetical protein